MNGRTRPGPDTGTCPACGRTVALLIDSTLSVHTPTGDPYAPACAGQRPARTVSRAAVRRASVRFGAGLGAVLATVTVAYLAPAAPDGRLTTVTRTTTTDTTP